MSWTHWWRIALALNPFAKHVDGSCNSVLETGENRCEPETYVLSCSALCNFFLRQASNRNSSVLLCKPKSRSQAGQNILYKIVHLANKRPNIAHSVNDEAETRFPIQLVQKFKTLTRKVKIIQMLTLNKSSFFWKFTNYKSIQIVFEYYVVRVTCCYVPCYVYIFFFVFFVLLYFRICILVLQYFCTLLL